MPACRVPVTAMLGLAAIAVAATGANAAVTMTGTNGAGEFWTTEGDWSDNTAAHAGEDYIVGLNGTSPRTVRTPATRGPHTFPGDSLTLAGGQLNLTADGDRINGLVAPGANPYDTNTTIGSLAVQGGGVIVNAVNSLPAADTQFLHGTLVFSGATPNFIRTGGANAIAGAHRNLTITSQVSGSGTVRMLQRGVITFEGAGNTFGGTWHSGGTNITVPGFASPQSNSADIFTTVVAASDQALGANSSFIVDAFSTLDLNYGWVTSGSLTLLRDAAQTDANAPLILDQDITVGALTIGTDAVPAGTYAYADLNDDATWGVYFREGGSGSITVGVPEPSSALALAAGTLLLMARRRRS